MQQSQKKYKMNIEFLSKNAEERAQFGDLDVSGRILFKWVY